MNIAKPTAAAQGDHYRLLRIGQVRQHLIGIHIDDGSPHRHQQHHVIGGFAGHLTPLAGLAIAGLENALVAVIHQGVQIGIRLHHHTAASPAVAAIRPAEFHVFFAAETQAAITALTGVNFNGGFIDKLHWGTLYYWMDAIVGQHTGHSPQCPGSVSSPSPRRPQAA